jgi:lipoprotein
MKKIILFLLTLACVACLLAACDTDARYKITFQDLSVLPEGVERIQNGQGTMASGTGDVETIYFTSGKGGSFFVTVTFKDGYDKGDFKIFANGKEASIRNDNENVVDYEVYPTSDVHITFTGKPVIKSYNVTATFYDDDDQEQIFDEFSYELKYVLGTEESTPIKVASLAELKDKINSDVKKVKHGTKIIITATHTGEIAFPNDFMIHGEYSGFGEYVEKNTKIVGDKQVKTWDIAVLSDVEIQLRLSSTRQSSSREIYTDSTFLHSGVYDGDFNRIVTLQALYDTHGKIYAPLDDNAVVRHLAEKYKKVTINGNTADGKFVYNDKDNRLYIQLDKPSAYQNGRADGYDVDFAEGVDDYMRGDAALTRSNDIDLKSQIMEWGDNQWLLYVVEYSGYRLKINRFSLGLCFAGTVNDIKVIVNGTKEFVFRNIQTLDEETQDFATIYRRGGNNTEYYGNYGSIDGKDETHKIAFDPSTFGEITSVEIVLASGE